MGALSPIIYWSGPGWYSGDYNPNTARIEYERIADYNATYQAAQTAAAALGYNLAHYIDKPPARMHKKWML